MKVVVDTSGWYAFVVIKDYQHKGAVKFLRSGEHELVVIEPVFIEATALIQNRQGKSLAVESGSKLMKIGVKRMEKSDKEATWDWFKKVGGKVSYVDCLVAMTAKKLGVPVFSFDSDFKKLGIRVVP